MPPTKPTRKPSSPTTRKAAPANAKATAATSASNGSGLVTGLAVGAVLLVGGLVAGGWWMQSQQTQAQVLRQQAVVYEHYLHNTPVQTPPSNDAARAAARAQALQTRQYLMSHPAVTPGTAFEQPGVQETGLAIVRAMDGAKGL